MMRRILAAAIVTAMMTGALFVVPADAVADKAGTVVAQEEAPAQKTVAKKETGRKEHPAKAVSAEVVPGGESAQKEPVDPVIARMHSARNPHVATVEMKARALIAPLTQAQIRQIYQLREAYGLVRSVEIVERDVSRAAKFCGEDNPAMKTQMQTGLQSWQGRVMPAVQERKKALQAAIDAQGLVRPGLIREYFKALDDAAIYAEKQLDKKVITTHEACKSLLESMDSTEKRVAELMKEINIPSFAVTE